jgi:hypothetical protein
MKLQQPNGISLDLMRALTGADTANRSPSKPGEITIANSVSPGTTNYEASLAGEVSDYLAGITAKPLQEKLDTIFPPVQTNDFFLFARADDEYFLTETKDEDIRALGGAFKRVQFRGTQHNGETLHKGLTMRLDNKMIPKGSNGKPRDGWQMGFAAHLMNRLIRAEMVRGFVMLSAAATNTAKVWDEASNPDADLRAQAKESRLASGLRPTHLLIGAGAQDLRQDAFEDAARTNQILATRATMTAAQIAEYCRVDHCFIEDEVKQEKKGGAKSNILDLESISYCAEPSPVIGDPSNVKRAWSASANDRMWEVVVNVDDAGTHDITVYHSSVIFIPISTGIIKRTVSAA